MTTEDTQLFDKASKREGILAFYNLIAGVLMLIIGLMLPTMYLKMMAIAFMAAQSYIAFMHWRYRKIIATFEFRVNQLFKEASAKAEELKNLRNTNKS